MKNKMDTAWRKLCSANGASRQHTKLFRNHCGAEMKNEKADRYQQKDPGSNHKCG